jgi:hypothetical protein
MLRKYIIPYRTMAWINDRPRLAPSVALRSRAAICAKRTQILPPGHASEKTAAVAAYSNGERGGLLMPPCQQYEPLIDAYADGELPAEQVAALEAHLGRCEGCSAHYRELVRLTSMVDGLEFPSKAPDGSVGVVRDPNAEAEPGVPPLPPASG